MSEEVNIEAGYILTAIDDAIPLHLCPALSCLCFVDPRWLVPVVLGDKTILDLRVRKFRYASEMALER